MSRVNVYEGEFPLVREEMGVRILYAESDTVGVATRHPFAPLPEDGDEGIVGLFRREDNLRPS